MFSFFRKKEEPRKSGVTTGFEEDGTFLWSLGTGLPWGIVYRPNRVITDDPAVPPRSCHARRGRYTKRVFTIIDPKGESATAYEPGGEFIPNSGFRTGPACTDECYQEMDATGAEWRSPSDMRPTAIRKRLVGAVNDGHLPAFMGDNREWVKTLWNDIWHLVMAAEDNENERFYVFAGAAIPKGGVWDIVARVDDYDAALAYARHAIAEDGHAWWEIYDSLTGEIWTSRSDEATARLLTQRAYVPPGAMPPPGAEEVDA